MSELTVHMFPCLDDNYGYLFHDPNSGCTASIDTPDANEIAKQCEIKGWRLTHIFNTHHHADHVGGNLALMDSYPNLVVVGADSDAKRIPGITQKLKDGEQFQFGEVVVNTFETPGHTVGHVVYYVPEGPFAFVGDTLFKMGCGRLFEGTPENMYRSLEKIAALPDDTIVYCAHEYTLANGRYALVAEPDNDRIKQVMKEDTLKRAAGEPTVPTSIGLEKLINPFMRAKSVEELGKRRTAKDHFKG